MRPRTYAITVLICIVLSALLAWAEGWYSAREWWEAHNGHATQGQCVNHMGENYSSSKAECVFNQTYGPFALFGMGVMTMVNCMVLVGVLAIFRIGASLVLRRRKLKQENI